MTRFREVPARFMELEPHVQCDEWIFWADRLCRRRATRVIEVEPDSDHWSCGTIPEGGRWRVCTQHFKCWDSKKEKSGE